MRLTFLLLILLLSLNSNGQNRRMYYTDVDFWEYQADTLVGKLDSILLIGIGNSMERIFLSDLGEELIKDFATKKVTASYVYLGKSLGEADKNYNDIKKSDYSTFMVFSPTDTSQFYTKHIKSRFFIPLPTTIYPYNFVQPERRRETYIQTFDITLFTSTNSSKRIWSATVDIDCEPQKKKGAKKLGNKIMSRFIANNYIGGQE